MGDAVHSIADAAMAPAREALSPSAGRGPIQDPERDIRNVMNAADIAVKLIPEPDKALQHYISSRGYVNKDASDMSDFMLAGGKIKTVVCNDRETLDGLKKAFDKGNINYVVCKMNIKGEEKPAFVIRQDEEELVRKARQMYLLAYHKTFQTDRNTVSMFSNYGKPYTLKGLDYAEMYYMKERASENRFMFAVESNKDGTYNFHCRPEDREAMDLLAAGMRAERNGSGRKIYDLMTAQRLNRELTLNQILAGENERFLVGNGNGSKVIYIDHDGAYFQDLGNYPRMDFISRESPAFEQELCEYVEKVRSPRIIRGDRAEELFKHSKEAYRKGERFGSLKDALDKVGKSDIRKVTDDDLETLYRAMEKDPRLAEAYYLMQQSVDLFRTKQEGVTKERPTDSEKELFEIEHKARINFEIAANTGDLSMRGFAQQYVDGSLDSSQVIEYSKEHYGDENVEWRPVREPLDIPNYLDINNDGIYDNVQKEEFRDYDFRDEGFDPTAGIDEPEQ